VKRKTYHDKAALMSQSAMYTSGWLMHTAHPGLSFSRPIKLLHLLSRYIAPKAQAIDTSCQHDRSLKMRLTKSFKLPQPYILAAMLCSFGGFLFGYLRLSFLPTHLQRDGTADLSFQHGHGCYWSRDSDEELQFPIWSTIGHYSWLDCVIDSDPSRHLFFLRRPLG